MLQHEVVEEAVARCRAAGLPLILEPIAYPLPSEDASTLPGRLGPLVLATVERLPAARGRHPQAAVPTRRGRRSRGRVVQEDRRGLRRHAVGAARRRGRPARASRATSRSRARPEHPASSQVAPSGRRRSGSRATQLAARLDAECVPLVRRLRALAEAARPAVAASPHRERRAAGRLVELGLIRSWRRRCGDGAPARRPRRSR